MGARAEAKVSTRQTVLAAAAQLFRARGYDGVTIRDVAAAAGRSTGAVFAHVKDKADLYAQAMGKPAPDVVGFLRDLADGSAQPAIRRSAQARELLAQLVGVEG